MSHIIRQQPNGLWCIYSTAVEEIIIYNAEREELIEYKLEKERERVEDQLDEIEENGYNPPKTNFTRTFDDIIEDSKLSVDESGELVDNTEE